MAKRRNIPPEVVDEWERLYGEQESLWSIAARGVILPYDGGQFEVSHMTVRYHLKKRGVSLRAVPKNLLREESHS